MVKHNLLTPACRSNSHEKDRNYILRGSYIYYVYLILSN